MVRSASAGHEFTAGDSTWDMGDLLLMGGDPYHRPGEVVIIIALAAPGTLEGEVAIRGTDGVEVLNVEVGDRAGVVPLRDFDGDTHAEATAQLLPAPLLRYVPYLGEVARLHASVDLRSSIETEGSLFGWYRANGSWGPTGLGGYRDPSGTTHDSTYEVFAGAEPGAYDFWVDARADDMLGWLFWADVPLD